jgi:hypothetical protein
VSSSGNSETSTDPETREKDRDKKGRKNSMFGNLFRKKPRKPSKYEDLVRDEDPAEVRVDALVMQKGSNTDDESRRHDADESAPSTQELEVQALETSHHNVQPEAHNTPVVDVTKESVRLLSLLKLIKF